MADDEIEQFLRRVARDLEEKGGGVTVNKVRSQVEEELDLDCGFLKGAEWKTRSKYIITNAINEPDSPGKPAPKSKAKPKAKAGTKRKSDDDESPKSKRPRKAAKVESEEELSDPELNDKESDAKPKKSRAKKPAKKSGHKVESEDDVDVDEEAKDDDDDEPAESVLRETKQPRKPSEDTSELSDAPDEVEVPKANGKSEPADGDESDMSVVFDEPLPKKKRQKKTETKAKTKSTATAKPKKAKSESKDVPPDEEEIKRLQGWLVKCGIRKLWHRELASCSTSKEKIKHLKGMLEDVGMTGRYSAEKARQIKESRELADELEAAQEFNQKWGQGESDEDEKDEEEGDAEESKGDAAPKRRMPKGFVDFGDSGDEGSD